MAGSNGARKMSLLPTHKWSREQGAGREQGKTPRDRGRQRETEGDRERLKRLRYRGTDSLYQAVVGVPS